MTEGQYQELAGMFDYPPDDPEYEEYQAWIARGERLGLCPARPATPEEFPIE